MASVNKVILIGNLGKDPETRYMPNGEAVTNITIATSENWVDKVTGEKKELTEWHRITFYRRLAEIAGEYLKKGIPIYVEGKLRTRKWQDKDGFDRYTTEIIADVMKMLGTKDRVQLNDATTADEYRNQSGSTRVAPQSSAQAPQNDFLDDDIPF